MLKFNKVIDVSHRFQRTAEQIVDDEVATKAYLQALADGKSEDEAGELYHQITRDRRQARREAQATLPSAAR